jgi:hypothetical protein
MGYTETMVCFSANITTNPMKGSGVCNLLKASGYGNLSFNNFQMYSVKMKFLKLEHCRLSSGLTHS